MLVSPTLIEHCGDEFFQSQWEVEEQRERASVMRQQRLGDCKSSE